MHRQASFATAFFPDDVEVGQDADFFYFPAFAEKDLGSPVLGGGTLMAIGSRQLLRAPIVTEVIGGLALIGGAAVTGAVPILVFASKASGADSKSTLGLGTRGGRPLRLGPPSF